VTGLWATLRAWLARLFLRGPLLRAWLRRQTRRLEQRYARELIEHSTKPAPVPPPLPARIKTRPLRRILFIADVMWEERELVPELRKICDVQVLNLHTAVQPHAPGSGQREAVVQMLTDHAPAAADGEPDLVLFYARPALLSGAAFDALRRRWSCPLFGLNLDEKLEFLDYGVFSAANDHYAQWASRFDLNLSNVRAVADWYADRGLPVRYLPEGFHPKHDAPPDPATPFRFDLSFVGSRKPEREALFEELAERGLRITPFGFGWPGEAEVRDPDEIYRASLMNLGIGLATPSEQLTTLKGRDFECPGAGACYLTTWNWELAAHYDIGREILCYRNVDELVEIFAWHRRRPEECRRIGRAAFERCRREHTWERRFREIFRDVGLMP
jgi:hypothetical protein